MRPSFRRIWVVAVAFAFLAGSTASAADAPALWSVDAKKSSATFSVSHLYVSNVTGTVPIRSGTVTLEPGSAIPSAVEAVLDPTQIATGEDERDGELQDADWFDTKAFPAWTYTSSKIVPGPDGKSFTVQGTLTVHGVAQPVTLAATVVRGLPEPAYHAVGHADRHGFGMTQTRQDGLIGTDLLLTLDVVLRPSAR